MPALTKTEDPAADRAGTRDLEYSVAQTDVFYSETSCGFSIGEQTGMFLELLDWM